MNPIISYFTARMREPSTWTAVATMLVALKVLPNDPGALSSFATIGVTVGGLLGVLLPEGSTSK